MPYYRRRFRRRPFRRYRRKPKPQGLWGTAQKALSLARSVKKLINVEHKKFDASYNAAVSNAQVTPIAELCYIAQGDTESSRNGNSIKVEGITMKGSFKVNGSATTVGDLIRLLVIQDNQQVADTAPSYSTIFESASPDALLNSESVGRFSILYDKKFVLSSQSPVRSFDVSLNMQHHVRYNGTAATDIQKGGLYVFCLSDTAANHPTINLNSRTKYIDN